MKEKYRKYLHLTNIKWKYDEEELIYFHDIFFYFSFRFNLNKTF